MRKHVLLLLAVFIVLNVGLVLAAEKPLFDEKVEITMLYPDHANYPFQEEWPTIKKMKELTNVALNPTLVADSDFGNKRGIVLSSGDIQDIVITKGATLPEFALNGVFVPINKYFDKLPHMVNKLKEWNVWDEYKAKLTELDGNIYYLPAVGFYQPVGFAIRKDLLEKHNLAVPTTYDELYQTLKKLKEIYPDSAPWTNQFGWGCTPNHLQEAFGTRMGWGIGNGFDYDPETDRWIHAPTSDEYKALLTYLNKMFEEGIIHQDAFVQEHDQWRSKLVTGKSFFTSIWYEQLSELNQKGKELVGPDFELAMIQPPEGPNGAYVPALNRVSTAAVLPSSLEKDPKHLDKVLKFVDWLYYSDEGLDLFTWGVEGLTYNVVDGEKVWTDKVVTDNNPDGTMDLSRDVGALNNALTPNRPFDWMLSMMSDEGKEYFKTLNDNNGIPSVDPALKMTSMEQEEIGLLSKTLLDYTEEMSQKFVYGKLSIEDDWADFVQGCKQRNLDRLEKMINDIWARQQEK